VLNTNANGSKPEEKKPADFVMLNSNNQAEIGMGDTEELKDVLKAESE
jgi:hypothetical protein